VTFKFGSWNVNGRRLKAGHIELLRKTDCDLLALQEATRDFHEELSKSQLFEWSVSSLSLPSSNPGEGQARRLGCSIFGRSPMHLFSSQLLGHLAFPERALVALLGSPPGRLTVCSFHIPPGANWGEVKPRTVKAIAEWLSLQRASIVFGIDANTPKTDHPNHLKNEWWWPDEPLLLGAAPLHQLRDALRVLLEQNPDAFSSIYTERPSGPLALSHLRGRGGMRTPCRYDFVYVSSDLGVHDVVYLFREAESVSDHALVVATLNHGPDPLPNSAYS
jgi:endonuclease/exonuclease/phosphatase family metal-dependent hydrolase